MNINWGFLRETEVDAVNSGVDVDTGLNRTGLDTYLHRIFPGEDWIHDKQIKSKDGKPIMYDNTVLRIRPDYRCEALKLIVEFDGIHHFTNPDVIYRDIRNTHIYEHLGYKVVRIPYFIQLTTNAVNTLFGVNITEPLFPKEYPSLGPKGRNTPAYLCPRGLKRMALAFKKFPDQYETNVRFLLQYESENPDTAYLSEVQLLIDEYNKLC